MSNAQSQQASQQSAAATPDIRQQLVEERNEMRQRYMVQLKDLDTRHREELDAFRAKCGAVGHLMSATATGPVMTCVVCGFTNR